MPTSRSMLNNLAAIIYHDDGVLVLDAMASERTEN
jgi:hypothetical protein